MSNPCVNDWRTEPPPSISVFVESAGSSFLAAERILFERASDTAFLSERGLDGPGAGPMEWADPKSRVALPFLGPDPWCHLRVQRVPSRRSMIVRTEARSGRGLVYQAPEPSWLRGGEEGPEHLAEFKRTGSLRAARLLRSEISAALGAAGERLDGVPFSCQRRGVLFETIFWPAWLPRPSSGMGKKTGVHLFLGPRGAAWSKHGEGSPHERLVRHGLKTMEPGEILVVNPFRVHSAHENLEIRCFFADAGLDERMEAGVRESGRAAARPDLFQRRIERGRDNCVLTFDGNTIAAATDP